MLMGRVWAAPTISGIGIPKMPASFMAATIGVGMRRACSISPPEARILGTSAMAACRIEELLSSA